MTEPAADRRERYAAALLGPDAAGSLDSAADELIDAVMAVADAELAAVPPADQTTDRAAILTEAADEAKRVAESLRKHHEFERSTGALDVMTELRRLAAEAQPTTQPDGETDAPRCDHCKQPGHSFEDCPHADEPATTCTCGDAGDCFVPAGHYADCPDAAGARQDGAQQ